MLTLFHVIDSHEEFPSVPKVNPSLGLKAGHDRRDVAAARKPRPPTRKTAQQVRYPKESSVSSQSSGPPEALKVWLKLV